MGKIWITNLLTIIIHTIVWIELKFTLSTFTRIKTHRNHLTYYQLKMIDSYQIYNSGMECDPYWELSTIWKYRVFGWEREKMRILKSFAQNEKKKLSFFSTKVVVAITFFLFMVGRSQMDVLDMIEKLNLQEIYIKPPTLPHKTPHQQLQFISLHLNQLLIYIENPIIL